MGNGSQYLSGSISRTGLSLWINAVGKHRPACAALRSGGDDAARERDDTVCRGGGYLSLRGPFADRLQTPNPVHRHHLYGAAGGECRSIREPSIKSRELEEKAASCVETGCRQQSCWDARRYPFVHDDRDHSDLRTLNRSRLEDCALLSRYGEHRIVGKANR